MFCRQQARQAGRQVTSGGKVLALMVVEVVVGKYRERNPSLDFW